VSKEPLKYEIVKKESCYHGFFQINRYHIRHELFKGGWSETFQREIFERGHAAGVLLLDPEHEELVLVEQFRAGAMDTQDNPWMLEPVAGIIEKNETPEQVGKRESMEEAGCEIIKLCPITDYLASAGGSTEKVWLFLGKVDANQVPEYAGLTHEHEDIKVHKLSVEQVFDRLEQGEFKNAMLLIGLQWLKLNWHKKDSFWSN
jgi:ADP-ribose pyrophosphatase